MSISPETVYKMAQLARLKLSPEEVALYTPELNQILDLVAQLTAIEMNDLEPLHNPLTLPQRLRLDVVTETDRRDALQHNAPAWEHNLFLVPKVVE